MAKALCLLFFLVILGVQGQQLSAAEEDIWVGTRFEPEQCLPLEPGRHTVKRKMAVITYDIRKVEKRFSVNGNLRFDKRWVPDNASEVELEILLIDEKYSCTKQINITSKVLQRESSFSFTCAGGDSHRYIRTYFIIRYAEKT